MLGAQKVLVGTGRAGTRDRARGRADRNMMWKEEKAQRKPQEARLDVEEGSMDEMATAKMCWALKITAALLRTRSSEAE